MAEHFNNLGRILEIIMPEFPPEILTYLVWVWPGYHDLNVHGRLKISSLEINSVTLGWDLDIIYFLLYLKYPGDYKLARIEKHGLMRKSINYLRRYNTFYFLSSHIFKISSLTRTTPSVYVPVTLHQEFCSTSHNRRTENQWLKQNRNVSSFSYLGKMF